jgi:hypothetical protein
MGRVAFGSEVVGLVKDPRFKRSLTKSTTRKSSDELSTRGNRDRRSAHPSDRVGCRSDCDVVPMMDRANSSVVDGNPGLHRVSNRKESQSIIQLPIRPSIRVIHYIYANNNDSHPHSRGFFKFTVL